MKSVKSLVKWILFVPVCVLSVVLTVISGANPELAKSFFATDMNGVAEIVAFSILGLFLACFVLSLFDRTTSPVHLLCKNYFCGITAFIAAFAFAATAALDVTTMIQVNVIDVMAMITAVFTALAGVALLFVGLSHFSGTNTTKGISVFYLMIPLWCGVHLIDRFLKHTAMPVDAADTMDLVMFVALAMFFINATMVHVLIPGKNAVKSSITFGFPAVISSFVYGITLAFNVLSSDSNAMIDFIPAVGYIVIGFYVLGFICELSFKAKSVEEQMLVTSDEQASDSETEDSLQEEAIASDDVTDEDIPSQEEAPLPFEKADVPEEEVTSADEKVTSVDEEGESADELTVESIEIFEKENVISEPDADIYEDDSFDEDENLDIPVNLPDADETFTDECDIAEELYREAQQMDTMREIEATNVAESEENMIIDGKDSAVEAVPVRASASASRPKGPTIREAVMYDDEDFILTIENSDENDELPSDADRDISSFILEKEELEVSGDSVEKTYADRLDEIDQLIISIQGGDSVTED